MLYALPVTSFRWQEGVAETQLERAKCTEHESTRASSGEAQIPAEHPAREPHQRREPYPAGHPTQWGTALPSSVSKAAGIGKRKRNLLAALLRPCAAGASVSSVPWQVAFPGVAVQEGEPRVPEHMSFAIARPKVAVAGAAGLAPTLGDEGAFRTPC